MLKRVRYANEVRATSVCMGRRDKCGGVQLGWLHVTTSAYVADTEKPVSWLTKHITLNTIQCTILLFLVLPYVQMS